MGERKVPCLELPAHQEVGDSGTPVPSLKLNKHHSSGGCRFLSGEASLNTERFQLSQFDVVFGNHDELNVIRECYFRGLILSMHTFCKKYACMYIFSHIISHVEFRKPVSYQPCLEHNKETKLPRYHQQSARAFDIVF